MSKPFQFSMRRMFGTVTMLAVAARLAVLFFAVRFDDGPYPPLLFLGFFAAGGAAIGCFEGRPFFGAFCGLLLGFTIGFFLPALGSARE
jgi:hypothetical protein